VRKEEETEIHFIMEPTGLAWMPLSCFLVTRGHHSVYRVSTQKSSDLRKFLNRHTKTDKVDTRTLEVLPEVDSKGIYQLYLPTADLGTLSRKSKHMAKLTKEASVHKLRIQSIFGMVNPNVLKAFGDKKKFSISARTLYRHFASPFRIATVSQEGFIEGFRKLRGTEESTELLEKIYQASVSAVKIYGPMVEQGTLPFDFQQVDEEIQTELRILEFLEAEIKQVQRTIDVYYKKVDNEEALKSIRGLGEKIAPAILGIIGDVSRFANIDKFRRFFGFVPKKNQSSNHAKKRAKDNQGSTEAAETISVHSRRCGPAVGSGVCSVL
jgi:transposase